MSSQRHAAPSAGAERGGDGGRRRTARERHAGRARHTLASRALALGALVTAVAVTYTLIDTSQQPARAPAPRAGHRTVTRTATRTVAPISSANARPPAGAPRRASAVGTCVPAHAGCRYRLTRTVSAVVPASWRREVSWHAGRVRLTLSGGPSELVDVDYTGRVIPQPSAIGRFADSRLTLTAHGRVWHFRASFCAGGGCTDYLLDVDGQGIAILARSARPETLAAAATIAQTVEVARG
jgi:hypothetical protein